MSEQSQEVPETPALCDNVPEADELAGDEVEPDYDPNEEGK